MSEELKPLKCWRSKVDTTLSGHTVIAREDEAPYAYTCAGVGEEIVRCVNGYAALAASHARMVKTAIAVLDDHDNRVSIYGEEEKQPLRIKAMEGLRAALADAKKVQP